MSFHDDCLVFDGHTDVPVRLWEAPADLALRQEDRHVDLPRLREGSVDGLVFALYVPASLDPARGWEHARALHQVSLAALGPGWVHTTAAEDVERAARRGEVAVVFGLENGRPLTVPGALAECAEWGVRYVTLTHVATHEWCDASTDRAAHGGLSPEGVAIVREMNRRGILPDVSHVSDDAVRQTLEVSRAPILASHSSARALCDHPRNLPDPLIRDIARGGGLVMANSYPAYLAAEAAAANRERMAELLPLLEEREEAYFANPRSEAAVQARLFAEHPLPPVPLARFVDHLIHLLEQAGEEHVGIGSDFDGIPETLVGFEDPSCFPSLTAALLARGVDRAGLRLILGANFLRLLRAAERLAG
jgi:membrane dipeptidase